MFIHSSPIMRGSSQNRKLQYFRKSFLINIAKPPYARPATIPDAVSIAPAYFQIQDVH